MSSAEEDAPILSRKAARKAGKQSTTATQPIKTHESQERSPFSVWIGNLKFGTGAEALKTWLTSHLIAHAGEITRVHMPKGKGPREENKGFAYVDFDNENLMLEAIKLSETNLEGRKLLIKQGNDFKGRPSTAAGSDHTAQVVALLPQEYKKEDYANSGLSKFGKKLIEKQKNAPCQTLFCGNLPFETTKESLMDFINTNHTTEGDFKSGLKKARIGTFEDTGKCKGWAFLDFIDTAHACVALLNFKNHKLKGQEIKIEFATPDAVRRGGNLPKDPSSSSKSKKDLSAKKPQKKEYVKNEKSHGAISKVSSGNKKRYFDEMDTDEQKEASPTVAVKNIETGNADHDDEKALKQKKRKRVEDQEAPVEADKKVKKSREKKTAS